MDISLFIQLERLNIPCTNLNTIGKTQLPLLEYNTFVIAEQSIKLEFV